MKEWETDIHLQRLSASTAGMNLVGSGGAWAKCGSFSEVTKLPYISVVIKDKRGLTYYCANDFFNSTSNFSV